MLKIVKPPQAIIDEVVACIKYRPTTGSFWWTKKPKNAKHRQVGRLAPCIDKLRVRDADGHRWWVTLHHLALYMATGVWPDGGVRFKNGNKKDFRLSNLVESDYAYDRRKRAINKNSKTGIRGVTYDPRYPSTPWRVQICHNYWNYNIGGFATQAEAIAAYQTAEKLLHEDVRKSKITYTYREKKTNVDIKENDVDGFSRMRSKLMNYGHRERRC
jgi:hypothetical protein